MTTEPRTDRAAELRRPAAAPDPQPTDDKVCPAFILREQQHLRRAAQRRQNLGCLVMAVICLIGLGLAIAGWRGGWLWTGLLLGFGVALAAFITFCVVAEDDQAALRLRQKLRERLKREWFYKLPTAEQDRLQAWADTFYKARFTDKKVSTDAEHLATCQHGAVPEGFVEVIARRIWHE